MSRDDYRKLVEDWVEANPYKAKVYRHAIIEECARMAESSVLGFRFPDVCEEIAAAIRALKDKP